MKVNLEVISGTYALDFTFHLNCLNSKYWPTPTGIEKVLVASLMTVASWKLPVSKKNRETTRNYDGVRLHNETREGTKILWSYEAIYIYIYITVIMLLHAHYSARFCFFFPKKILAHKKKKKKKDFQNISNKYITVIFIIRIISTVIT